MTDGQVIMHSMNFIWQPIKTLLIKIGRIQTVIVMSVFYYLILGPMAILYQLFHRQKQSGQTYWIKKEPIEDMELYLKRQF